jgi:hypothetical protein
MRIRLSTACKDVNAPLLKVDAQGFRSGQKFDHTVFFEEHAGIHHIFSKGEKKGRNLKGLEVILRNSAKEEEVVPVSY